MIVHVECIYGFYHGQDPRTFSPDAEACTAGEIAKHRQACEQAEKGEWSDDGESGCRITPEARASVCSAGLSRWLILHVTELLSMALGVLSDGNHA